MDTFEYLLEPYKEPAVNGYGVLLVQPTNSWDDDNKREWLASLTWHDPAGIVRIFEETIHAPESADENSVAASALGFFTLLPGDTDEDYFGKYTEVQCVWRDEHAESVGLLAYAGEGDNGESLAHLRKGK